MGVDGDRCVIVCCVLGEYRVARILGRCGDGACPKRI